MNDADAQTSLADAFVALIDDATRSKNPEIFTEQARGIFRDDIFDSNLVELHEAVLSWQDLKDKLYLDWKYILDVSASKCKDCCPSSAD